MMTLQRSVSAKPAGAFNLIVAARFRELLKLVPSLRLKTSVMVVVGILSGLMEMVGITLPGEPRFCSRPAGLLFQRCNRRTSCIFRWV